MAGRSLVGGVSGGIGAELAGGKFGRGFVEGVKTAVAGYLFNHMMHHPRIGLVYHRHWDNEPNFGIEGETGPVTHELPPDGSSQAFFDAMATTGKVYLRALQETTLFVQGWGVRLFEAAGVVIDFVTGSKGDIPLPYHLSIPDGINPDEAW